MPFGDLVSCLIDDVKDKEQKAKLDALCRKTLRTLDEYADFNAVPDATAGKLAIEWGFFAPLYGWGESKLDVWERRAKGEKLSPQDLKDIVHAGTILRKIK